MDSNFQARVDEMRNANSTTPFETELKTSQRVLKRVTDGIYRQPASALRELISNAYDADATQVEIQTDAPRFNTIRIIDDGIGLTHEALLYLIQHIGGSSKRTNIGVELQTCDPNDPDRSVGGRKLIGKIGIGLFAVSQLTKEFQIITKVRGANHRTFADIILSTHDESQLSDEAEVSTGNVLVWNEPASDSESHGTEVILRQLLPRTFEELTSQNIWSYCDAEYLNQIGVDSKPQEPPVYHVGRVSTADRNVYLTPPKLPWDADDTPQMRFRKLVDEMWHLRTSHGWNPTLKEHLDNYLRMIWDLSLSAPLDYLESHPFDLTASSDIKYYQLSNQPRGSAVELDLKHGESLRTKLDLKYPERGGADRFRLFVDGLELFRPVLFNAIPRPNKNIPYSLLFVGIELDPLKGIPEEVRGGKLSFEAYMFWNQIIVPKEHAGVLVRVSDASGTLFDSTFLNYPVSEQTRKGQVVMEIFITAGMDAALNIDRESFNYSHPHCVYLSNWVHSAFRQFSTKHKNLGSLSRSAQRVVSSNQRLQEIEQYALTEMRENASSTDFIPPEIEIASDTNSVPLLRQNDTLVYDREAIYRNSVMPDRTEIQVMDAKTKALAGILDSFGILKSLSYSKQQRLLSAIINLFNK